RNPRDSQLRGIDIDLAKTLSNDLGVAPVFVDSSFASFMDDLDTDKCDIAMFGIGHTEARRARIDLTEPHLRSGMYGITTKTNSSIRNWADIDQPGRVVAVQKGTVMEPYMLQNAKKAEVRVIVPPDTREDEVLSGRADVFMTDYPYSLRMQFQHDWARVIAPPQIVNPVDYGFAIKKGQPDWLARINSFIAQIKKRRAPDDRRQSQSNGANRPYKIALFRDR
ncbi:ABC transporter substrate-binding protein, partial [Elstera litoralis]|uniref:ABC transporter substrate-binding protein n=1 Tax=Elstera litoralis TaxID=552518 RepID=UPI00069780C5